LSISDKLMRNISTEILVRNFQVSAVGFCIRQRFIDGLHQIRITFAQQNSL